MTPRERAKSIVDQIAVRYSLADQDVLRDKIEQAILADRTALQSETLKAVDRLFMRLSGAISYEYAHELSRKAVQSVFAQSQPEESKPTQDESEGWIHRPHRYYRLHGENKNTNCWSCGREENHLLHRAYRPDDHFSDWISIADSDRRVLAEREACAEMVEQCFCDHRNSSLQNCVSCELAAQIRARSNQPEEKSSRAIPKPVIHDMAGDILNGQEDRIAVLHKWLADDQKIIQQLNESNQRLAEENRELRKRFEHSQSAILAEREACAKTAEEDLEVLEFGVKEADTDEEKIFLAGSLGAAQAIARQIRARSNAPESPNKPQVGFFGLDLSSGKAKEEKIAPDPVST